jgi:cytochrome b561
MTWLNKENIAVIIENFLKETDQVLSKDQLIVLAKQIRKPMWQWHIYIGYLLVGLFCLRFILSLFGEMRIQNSLGNKLNAKEKFQKWSYVIFYFCVSISLVTGLLIELGPRNLKETFEEIHVLSIYYLMPFIIIHLTGLLIGEFTNQKGIISRIINGGKKD